MLNEIEARYEKCHPATAGEEMRCKEESGLQIAPDCSSQTCWS